MAKWIWLKEGQRVDSHADFFIPLHFSGEKTELRLSADSDYTLYVNGKFVSCNQYRDFPFFKIYDSIDITEYLKEGENAIAIEVWYYGAPNWSYYTSNAGLWYEIYQDGKKCTESDENTLSRLSPRYQHGMQRKISPQMGFTYHYIATAEDAWRTELLEGFEKSSLVDGISEPLPRPIERMNIMPPAETKYLFTKDNRVLFDIGCEIVGFPTLRLKSPVAQKLKLMWGEHIDDGHVRDIIDCRNFSIDLTVGEGVTDFTNYCRRLGTRYLEIKYEEPVEVEYCTVLPCEYPLTILPFDSGNELRNRIYNTAVRTLVLCMHDHYEDCPWREQTMYIGDSRNQGLCGYYAFGEYKFPRAALVLISKDDRKDGLLYIVTPYKGDMHPIPSCIPNSSNGYVQTVYEYMLYSKDYSLGKEVYPKLLELVNTYLDRMENGLVPVFPEDNGCWNFYEWAEDLDYTIGNRPKTASPFDAALNCNFSRTLGFMQEICDMIGIKADYRSKQEALNKKIFETFYNEKTGLVQDRTDTEFYTEYVNSVAILCGAVSGDQAKHIAKALADGKLSKTSLAFQCNKYDALIAVDKEKYSDYILNDIDTTYKKMLDAGATSFWETEIGASDFDGAGSLCHGWSSMPVYYYHVLGVNKK